MRTSGLGVRRWVGAGAVPAVFLVLAGWIAYEALRVPLGSFRMPGAGFFPLGLAIALAMLALLLWLTSLSSHGAGLAGADGGAEDRSEWRRVPLLVAVVAAAVVAFEPVGFLPTIVPFLAITTCIVGEVAWARSIGIAVVGGIAAYVAFARVLQIALPSGVMPF